MARTNAARPAADEARPAAVGKLFSDTSFKERLAIFGRDGSAASRADRLVRNSLKHA